MILRVLCLSALVFAAHFSYAKTDVIKTCLTTFPSLEPGHAPVSAKMEILSDGEKLSARVTQNGRSYDDVAEVMEERVRENVPTDLEDPSFDSLNQAERLISHAIILSTDPILEGKFSAGIDLTKVRSAKLFIVGQQTNMGSATIVEAKDKNGNILGSFLGGFLVAPCE